MVISVIKLLIAPEWPTPNAHPLVGDENRFREATHFTALNEARMHIHTYLKYFTHPTRYGSFKAIKCLYLIDGPLDFMHAPM